MSQQTETIDVLIENNGSIFSIIPLTQEGRDWIDNNVQSEGWQWLGDRLNVEPRYAYDLAAGMLADGLRVE
jgi:hypothetical protein